MAIERAVVWYGDGLHVLAASAALTREVARRRWSIGLVHLTRALIDTMPDVPEGVGIARDAEGRPLVQAGGLWMLETVLDPMPEGYEDIFFNAVSDVEERADATFSEPKWRRLTVPEVLVFAAGGDVFSLVGTDVAPSAYVNVARNPPRIEIAAETRAPKCRHGIEPSKCGMCKAEERKRAGGFRTPVECEVHGTYEGQPAEGIYAACCPKCPRPFGGSPRA